MKEWSLKNDYRRKRPAMIPKTSKPENPPERSDYFPTIKGMSSRLVEQYAEKHTSGRKSKMSEGKFDEEYLNYVNYPPK